MQPCNAARPPPDRCGRVCPRPVFTGRGYLAHMVLKGRRLAQWRLVRQLAGSPDQPVPASAAAGAPGAAQRGLAGDAKSHDSAGDAQWQEGAVELGLDRASPALLKGGRRSLHPGLHSMCCPQSSAARSLRAGPPLPWRGGCVASSPCSAPPRLGTPPSPARRSCLQTCRARPSPSARRSAWETCRCCGTCRTPRS